MKISHDVLAQNKTVQFLDKEFRCFYSYLLDGKGDDARISEMADLFEWFFDISESFRYMVRLYVQYRGDIIATTNESAAFMAAMIELNDAIKAGEV